MNDAVHTPERGQDDGALDAALAIHQQVVTLDTHIDIPWPIGPDPFQEGTRRVDLPKMVRGGLSAGCFVAYVPQNTRQMTAEDAAYNRAIAMLDRIGAMQDTVSDIKIRTTPNADAIETAKREGALAAVPCVENGYAIGSDLGRLAEFRKRGAVYMTLTHNGHNGLADSCNPRRDLGDREVEHGGLSALGKSAIAVMNRLGMLVDVAHTSRDTMLQAAEVSRSPIVSTHSCVSALCDHSRNMADWQLDVIRDVKGVIQITAVAAFLKPNAKPEDVTVADFCDHVDYAVKRIGIDHVGISSDFDGGGWIRDWTSAADCPNVTAELLRRGYDCGALQKLWGGNFLRVMREAERIAD
ncbi:dipeptidase [Rhodopila sp.]|jgi:membrane dipeptidase|uniref:dipeptidase n=1 Tax=Rhodopila sp. TaxID=2480087 RepID=UPI002C84499F|nr:dipeptidase [Rhodopila sp.]HVZ09891.1 dipeptidase [Rhodopila sp.]